MPKKKDFPILSRFENKSDYELEFLRLENQKLKEELSSKEKVKMSKELERDISDLVKISMRMKNLLEACRAQTLPMELAKEIDRVLKELENNR
jgi:hypothetical protein